MYTTEEYEKRIKELKPVAREIMEKKTPDETREMVSMMNPEDAYIVGIWLGKLLAFDEFRRTLSGAVVKIVKTEILDAGKMEVPGDFNFN